MAMFILKVSFLTCGSDWQAGILSPSGHTGISTTVYGALAIVSARQAPRWRRFLIALVIALSRVILGCIRIGGVHRCANQVRRICPSIGARSWRWFGPVVTRMS
jgi:hypothetical protein